MSQIAIAGAATGSATFTIESPATSTNRTLTLPDSTGTVVVSGTTPSLNGITFPATQVASAGANTLDDYEEGTWTPTDNSGAGLSITDNGCTYTKIGNTVSIRAYLSYPSTANGNGASLAGLPFTNSNWGPASVMSSGSPNAGIVRAVSGQTTMDIKSNVNDTALSNANLSNTFLIFNFTYKV